MVSAGLDDMPDSGLHKPFGIRRCNWVVRSLAVGSCVSGALCISLSR